MGTSYPLYYYMERCVIKNFGKRCSRDERIAITITRVRYLYTRLASAHTQYSVCAPYKNGLEFENLTLRLSRLPLASIVRGGGTTLW